MATKQEQIDFVRRVYPAAQRMYAKNPEEALSPLFVTAQAALETGWRIKGIDNNIFGITKGKSWTGKTKLVLTTEYFSSPNVKFVEPERIISITQVGDKYKYSVYRLFRAYDSLEDCLEDQLKLLKSSGYKDAWPYRDDPVEFAKRIVDDTGAKYATATNYAAIMASVIQMVDRIVQQESIGMELAS
ncbi:MAG: glucosaminidase domain-containing protein [Candidatus Azobacteroides sp.]|nr:glucosaminidase domain-containing protein [Candidatus Azobacteroides sp.]